MHNVATKQPSSKRDKGCCLGCLCVSVIALVYIFGSDYLLRRSIDRKMEARRQLDSMFSNALLELSKVGESISARANSKEQESITFGIGYHYTKDEASERGSDAYRRSCYDELTNSLRQMRELDSALQNAPSLSPTEAKRLVRSFDVF